MKPLKETKCTKRCINVRMSQPRNWKSFGPETYMHKYMNCLMQSHELRTANNPTEQQATSKLSVHERSRK